MNYNKQPKKDLYTKSRGFLRQEPIYIYIYIGSRTPTKPAKIILHSKRYMRKLFEEKRKSSLLNVTDQ